MQVQEEHTRRAPVKLDPAVEEKMHAYVRWRSNRAKWSFAPADDIAQEAALAVLEHDPEPLAAFTTCRRAVGQAVRRWQSPVSWGPAVTDAGSHVAVELTELHRASLSTSPENAAAARQLLGRWFRLAVALESAEVEATRALPEFVRTVGVAASRARWLGAHRVHVELAEAHGTTPQKVVYALTRYDRAAEKSERVAELRRALVALRREALS